MMKIALAGNPNSGKTTLFNLLTGSNQYVGNWPGVTVEKKEGIIKGNKDVTLVDLPGIYSLSPYTPEEVVSRSYLVKERPDAIINIVDGSNIERNLYLTMQLTELGIPVVMAINMIDVVERNGGIIHTDKIAEYFGCEVIRISALKNIGIKSVINAAVHAAKSKKAPAVKFRFDTKIENAITKIMCQLPETVEPSLKRYYAIKLFERDLRVIEELGDMPVLNKIVAPLEKAYDDESDSIIINGRYEYISSVIDKIREKRDESVLTYSDKIDLIVTHRIFGLPVFAAVMFLIYFIAMSTVGLWATDWASDGLFGDGFNLFGIDGLFIPGIPVIVRGFLESIQCADWLNSLIVDGIIGGVGSVLSFVPQLMILFLLLALVEDCGYMSRVAFVMDKIFRKFGMSGKSFIPLLVSTGCGVPAIMASRTIENDRERKITIITATFIPCGAKIPMISFIVGAVCGGSPAIAAGAYLLGLISVVISGTILKKLRLFNTDPSPFVVELPAYHMPVISNALKSMWDKSWSFIKKAGTLILLATIVIWFMSSYGITENGFGATDIENSLMSYIGRMFAWIFVPLGFGDWKTAVSTLTGFIAKENIVGTMGVFYGLQNMKEAGNAVYSLFAADFSMAAALSFMIFNQLCAPCVAAMGAYKRELGSAKWFMIAFGYQMVFAYSVSMIFYNLIGLFLGVPISLWTFVSAAAAIVLIYLVVRKPK